jgi:hypothetical protein
MSYTVAYDLWLDSWQAALSALGAATQIGTLSANQAAAHKAVIAAEREVVSRHFRILLGVPDTYGARSRAGAPCASATRAPC